MKNRYLLFLLFLVCGISLPSLSGLLIYPFSMISHQLVLEYTLALSLIFLLISIFLYSRQTLKNYWQILFSFFIASLALFFDFLANIPSDTMNGFLLDMLVSASIITSIILLFTKISGTSFSKIFLKKGNLKLGIIVGLIGFFIFVVIAIPVAEYMFQGQNLSINRVIAWLPG